MFLTIKELSAQIELAKEQLIQAVVSWMDTQQLSNEDKEKWLQIFHAPTREALLNITRETGLAVIHNDEIVKRINAVIPNEVWPILRRTYQSIATDDPLTSKLCAVLTVVEQLFYLEELLVPQNALINWKGLKLANQMVCSLNNEWCEVEPGVQTVQAYRARFMAVEEQLKAVQQNNLPAFELFRAQIDIRIQQISETLAFSVDVMSSAFSLEKDQRNWLLKKFSAYLPWHAMFNSLAVNLFGMDGGPYIKLDTFLINEALIFGLHDFIIEQLQQSYDELFSQYSKSFKDITAHAQLFQAKLTAMAKQYEVLEQFSVARHFALYPPSTRMLGVWGLFGTLNLLNANGLTPALHASQAAISHSSTDDKEIITSDDEQHSFNGV